VAQARREISLLAGIAVMWAPSLFWLLFWPHTEAKNQQRKQRPH
jgi:4-amino-4-deoxy-L-arabinose transferase-like glycosyltransferase